MNWREEDRSRENDSAGRSIAGLTANISKSPSKGSEKDTQHITISVAVPSPPPETVFDGGLPSGALEAVRSAYGAFVQVIEPPESGFHLTIQVDLTKIASSESACSSF